MKKVLSFGILALFLGIFFTGCDKTQKVEKKKKAETASVGFLEILPEHTKVVVTINSLSKTLAKFPWSKYPEIAELIKKNPIGIDFTDPNSYREQGINPQKPLGVALLRLKGPRAATAVFVGVSDAEKFNNFLRRVIGKQIPNYTKKISSVPCLIFAANQKPVMICCNRGDYSIIYSYTRPSSEIEKTFEEDILSHSSRLAKSKLFQSALKGAKGTGDAYVYLDVENIQKNFPSKIKSLINMEGSGPVIISTGLEGTKFRIKCYAKTKAYAKVIAKEGGVDLVKQMPHSLLAHFIHMPFQASHWQKAKDEFRKVFKNPAKLPREIRRQIPRNIRSIEDLFEFIQKQLKKELGLEINLEEDIIKNFEGDFALSLHSLPTTTKELDFDLTLAAKLKNTEKAWKLIEFFLEKLQKKEKKVKVELSKIGESKAYSIDLRGMKDGQVTFQIRPTIGIYKNYLIFASQKSLFAKIVKEEVSKKLLESVKIDKVKTGIQKGANMVGFIKIAALVRAVLPLASKDLSKSEQAMAERVASITDRFQEMGWYVKATQEDVSMELIIQADQDILDLAFENISKSMK